MNSAQGGLILYGTMGCHLCEQAKTELELAGASVVYIDIADDDGLLEKYGICIPVLLRCATGEELGWPFDAVEVMKFLS